jgi:hypothetical protein
MITGCQSRIECDGDACPANRLQSPDHDRSGCDPHVAAVISSTLSAHLLTILQNGGMTPAAAVGLGALVGPSQVAARTIEMVIARFHHPIWTKFASVTFVVIGVSALAWHADHPVGTRSGRASDSNPSRVARYRSRCSAPMATPS